MTAERAMHGGRNWVAIAALLLAAWSCHKASSAYELAEQAEDQADAASGQAARANSRVDDIEANQP